MKRYPLSTELVKGKHYSHGMFLGIKKRKGIRYVVFHEMDGEAWYLVDEYDKVSHMSDEELTQANNRNTEYVSN